MADLSTDSHAAKPTGAGLMAFLDFAISKGYLKVPTGQAMKTACKEVLSAIDSESWEAAQITELDMDDVLRRFETLRAMKFSTGSLGTYKSRFKKSVAMFNDFRGNPSGWRPDVKSRVRSASPSARPAISGPSAPQAPMSFHQPSSSTSVITYPFPLREGVLVSLQLPADLSKREARRLSAFLDSVAVEDVGTQMPMSADAAVPA